ncbi:Plasma membrane protein [Corchorus olitorius]|uniref:Plasma membrane protein n=1 Tax=Corchorus olitorius TaxID=93759 RepID=A0A1R3JNX4_9ROSI|nr:Plasma membrane protein [Corchorus olitorius]
MWVEIICGLIIYRIFRRFFYGDDDILEVETSDSNAIFFVANRLEKLYSGNVYVGLRIPDADTGSPQNIDIVILTKGEAVVISVKNLAGFVSINEDGSWTCEGGRSHKEERHPDPVAEAKKQASVLESYLEQRGVALPEGYFSYKVVIPNPKFSPIHCNFPSEVITYEEWVKLKPEPVSMFSGWIKGAFRGGKKEMQESFQQQLKFILSTAPMWDRLELKGSKYVLGEFLEFKGKQEDTLALRNIKRSKVSRLIIQKTSMFGLAPSKLQVLYCPRDYRNESASGSEWKEATVRSSTEVIFHPQNSTKVRKFKFSSITSMSLSA